jgi:hypothetical protein
MAHNKVRGPYKQYEIDTSIKVPKSTLCDRRKRHIAELDVNINDADNDRPNSEVESDDSDVHFQVRL